MSFTPASSWKQFAVSTLSKRDSECRSLIIQDLLPMNDIYLFTVPYIHFFLHQHYFWLKPFLSSLPGRSIFLPLQKNLRNHSYSLLTQFSPEARKLQLVFSCRRCYCLFALAVFFWISSNLRLALNHYWAKTKTIRFKLPLGLTALILIYF